MYNMFSYYFVKLPEGGGLRKIVKISFDKFLNQDIHWDKTKIKLLHYLMCEIHFFQWSEI